jgi:monoterpene epsilon-lactone hydrolase
MPSLVTTLLREQIRLLKPIITSFSTNTARGVQEALGELGAKVVAGKVEFREFQIGDIPAATATPTAREEGDRRVVLYLHGGGYVAGSIRYARGFAGVLAAGANVQVTCIAYRLAPEHPHPAALEDAMAAYEHLLSQGAAPEDISLIGESAGGGLIFALCLALKERGMALPAHIVALSPWTDLRLRSRSYEDNRQKDVCLTRVELTGFAAAYAPDGAETPLVSPILGDLHGLPPCRIYVGGDEILFCDAADMAARLAEAEVPCTLTVADGLWHAYVLYGVPEANDALDEIKLFLEN